MKQHGVELVPVPPVGTHLLITNHDRMPSIIGRVAVVIQEQVGLVQYDKPGWAYPYMGVWVRLLGNNEFEYFVRLDWIMWDDLSVRAADNGAEKDAEDEATTGTC